MGSDGIQKILSAVGRLRRWEALDSVTDEHKGAKFGFALFEDVESLHNATRLLVEEEVQVPKAKQPIATEQPKDDTFEGIETVTLQTALDASTQNYLEAFRKEEEEADAGEAHARAQLRQALRDLFYPLSVSRSDEMDTFMDNAGNGEAVEVVNIGMAQEDELTDIPAEIREVVLKEIASFRERSNQHDLERLRGEEEFEEQERRRMGASRTHDGSNGAPLGPRGAPSGPRAQNGTNGTSFVNGGVENGGITYRDDDTDASDEELNRRHLNEEKAEADKMYNEAERKWVNRERSRQAALERERDREKNGAEAHERRVQDSLAHDKEWDDERESSRKAHLYYRDHAAWARKRGMDRADEEAKDEADRRQEKDDERRAQAQLERARGMADSFLDKQTEESERRDSDAAAAAASAASTAAAAAPQPFKLSLGAAAQKAQASRGVTQRRTVAEVEGLLDDEEEQAGARRQLIPIEYDASAATRGGGDSGLTEEEVSQAVRALAQEIPSDRDGLWAWAVRWEYMDEAVIADKLKPFVEKKIVEYLGVQEEMLVEAVEEHLRKHGTAAALVEELEGVSSFLSLFISFFSFIPSHLFPCCAFLFPRKEGYIGLMFTPSIPLEPFAQMLPLSYLWLDLMTAFSSSPSPIFYMPFLIHHFSLFLEKNVLQLTQMIGSGRRGRGPGQEIVAHGDLLYRIGKEGPPSVSRCDMQCRAKFCRWVMTCMVRGADTVNDFGSLAFLRGFYWVLTHLSVKYKKVAILWRIGIEFTRHVFLFWALIVFLGGIVLE